MPAHGEPSPLWDDQFRAIFDSSLDAVIAIDDQGKIVDWSRQATETFGWRLSEVIGRELVDFVVPEEYQAKHLAGLQRFRETGEAPVVGQRLELAARRRDGSTFPIELSVTRLSKAGKSYFNAFVRDISDWHRQEEQQTRRVREAELISETTVETATAESFERSLQVLLDAICDQIQWPLGHVWLPDESDRYLHSMNIWHNDPGLDVSEFRAITEASRFRRGEGLPGDIWLSGQPDWVEDITVAEDFQRAKGCKVLPLRTSFAFPVLSHKEVVAVLEFFHTDTRQVDQELLQLVSRLGQRVGNVVQSRRFEHQQAKLAAIVDSSFDAIIGKDLDGVITSWNSGAERIYGYSEDEAIGQTVEIVLPDDVDHEEPEVVHAMETGQRLEQFQTTRRTKEGKLIQVSLTVSPIADSAGHIVGSSSIIRDISGRQRREQELHAAKELAVKANRARGEFLANVSHELRTPMNAIIGMTQLALEEQLSPELRSYLQTADEAAHSLLSLLNDILDFSKMESGKFTVASEPFSVMQVIDETAKTWSAQAFAKGLELVCEVPSELPRQVLGDSMRLRQILTNLLSNAIKFTDKGEIALSVQVVRIWPKEVRLRFSVSDTGVGVPAEHQHRILEPFTQVDSSSTRQHGGTGLGLAISSELLRLMGGRLSLQSAPGEGSTFSFRLSFDLVDNPQPAVDGLPLEKLQDLPVLVVDDNETNRRIISETLKRWTMQPAVAEDAEQAIGIYQRTLSEGKSFPLIIVDALMPGMDGYELSKKLGEFAVGTSPPVILMVSSTDRQEFRDREKQAQVAVYLQKPVTQSDLMDAVMRALDVQPSGLVEQVGEWSVDEGNFSLSILLAEDTPANQKVVTSLLKKRGHEVTVANNGREAIDRFKSKTFDVVLMDVQMPILNGYQATAAIREYEKESGRTTPIIAMTAHAMRGDREKCLQAGMDAYIAKPLDVKQLQKLIESVAEDRKAKSETTKTTAAATSENSVLDYRGAMERLGGDAELFREFVGFYDEDSKELLKKIEAAVDAGDGSQLEHSAHSLKGLAANLGATGVVDASFSLERIGQSRSLENAAAELSALLRENSRLDEILQEYRR